MGAGGRKEPRQRKQVSGDPPTGKHRAGTSEHVFQTAGHNPSLDCEISGVSCDLHFAKHAIRLNGKSVQSTYGYLMRLAPVTYTVTETAVRWVAMYIYFWLCCPH